MKPNYTSILLAVALAFSDVANGTTISREGNTEAVPASTSKTEALDHEIEMIQSGLQKRIEAIQRKANEQSRVMDAKGNEIGSSAKQPFKFDITIKWVTKEMSLHLPTAKMVNKRIVLSLPQTAMRTKTVSFDVPEPCMKRVHIGPAKFDVPGIRMKRVEWKFDLPEFRWGKTEFVMGIPQFGWEKTSFKMDIPRVTVGDIHLVVPVQMNRTTGKVEALTAEATKLQASLKAEFVSATEEAMAELKPKLIERATLELGAALNEIAAQRKEVEASFADGLTAIDKALGSEAAKHDAAECAKLRAQRADLVAKRAEALKSLDDAEKELRASMAEVIAKISTQLDEELAKLK